MAFKYAIVLTGSIATGKSSTAGILKKMGFEIIDADTIAHEILNEQHQQISEIFGENIVQNGIVNRKALGAIVFSDEQKRKNLEQLLHPLIVITSYSIHYTKLYETFLCACMGTRRETIFAKQ